MWAFPQVEQPGRASAAIGERFRLEEAELIARHHVAEHPRDTCLVYWDNGHGTVELRSSFQGEECA